MLLIALPAFLLITTGIGGWRLDDFADSISANYATPLRDIFVGVLVAIGACLIVYRGKPVEDLALNVAGFYAMFVAFVPYSLDGVLTGRTKLQGQELTDAKAAADELVKVLPVIVISLVVVAAVFISVEGARGLLKRHTKSTSRAHKLMFIFTLVLGAAFLILLARGLIRGTYAGIHMVAAILMIVGLATAIASHGWDPDAKESTPKIAGQYRVIFWIMVVVGLALIYHLFFKLPFENAVAYIEWAAIFLFTWYWVAETVRQESLIKTGA
ncbi:hypothetical protein FJ661_20130 [Pseudarthrobacter phenanthrenivorans]|uniref:hypothetical protein n=1 Tax=Pseudarthrobacter phenanthrenivorans TaxID=361575 RepID=UPI0011287DEF|nr:hypothetical protein [Pseudarthrobacter phenanthrenivorans]TPV47828.1 hypothetical protein FJ661_20130 [Pseudarthrobacter phenanthrenivorans]